MVFWLALVPLLLLLGWLALRACALNWPSGAPLLPFCPAGAAADPNAALLERERVRGLTLEARLEQLQMVLADTPPCPGGPTNQPPGEIARLPDGPAAVVPGGPVAIGPGVADPAPPLGPEPAAVSPPLPEQIPGQTEAADVAPPETPDVPGPPDTPPLPDLAADRPEDGTEPPDSTVERPDETPLPPDGADLPIDESGFDDRDLAALEGCWNLASDYRITNPDTGEVAATDAWQMCFDDQGRGTQTLDFENGTRCEGRVQAQFEPDGSLRVIDLGNVPCDNGLAIVQRVIDCSRQADGSVDCTTSHVTPPAFPVPVRFQR